MILIAVTTQVSAHEEWPDTNDTLWAYLVEGLKQFPFPSDRYKLIGNTHLVTLRGYTIAKCHQLYKDQECIRFYLVTSEGKDAAITVILPESEARRVLFMHEIWPDIGRYVNWNPVIVVSLFSAEGIGPENPTIYHPNDMILVGRFYFHNARDDSQKSYYHFERYPHPHNPH